MEGKVITVFNKGKGDCDHEWIYAKTGSIQMTYPQKFIVARICEKCGQHEMVELDKIPKSTNNFTEIVKHFQQEDN
jgi:hypothetical protein